LGLNHDLSVTRYPTAGIDNMLVIRAGRATVINYNDCNLPAVALRTILRKVGPVDVVLTNYNHAAKLLDQRPDDVVKEQLAQDLLKKVRIFEPRAVIPFASHHYYRSPYSASQNSSMLQLDDIRRLANTDARILPLAVGDRVAFDANWTPNIEPVTPPLAPVPLEQKTYPESLSWPTLVDIAQKYQARINTNYFSLLRWTKPLRIHVADLDRQLVLNFGHGVREGEADAQAHIVAHSTALQSWMGRRFGEDAFFDGADFGILSSDLKPLRRVILTTMVDNKHLSPAHVLSMLRSRKGMQFLRNRREEIWATLVGRRFRAGESRL
jgi:hypothetical protein